jgi:oxygen-independent coproporphyrinogen-3 oxidase
MECNPGTVDAHKLRQYRTAGINRISFGLQSMDARLLKRIGRIHTPETFLKSFHDARDAGFSNINADIMSGLPGQTLTDYIDTLRQVTDLGAEHISAYGLILEEGTPLIADVQQGIESVPDKDAVSDMLDAGILLLNERGYGRYEISNYSRSGYACRHNLNYWNNGEYLGIGAAAHSAWRLHDTGKPAWTRWSNPAELDTYEASAGIPLAERELIRIDTNEEAFETIMLGLRTVRGVSLAEFFKRFSCSLEQFFPHAVNTLTANGWLQIADGYARLSPHGLDMQNAALQYFLEESEKAPD